MSRRKVNDFREAFEAATGTKLGLSDPLILGVSSHDLRVARSRRRGQPLRPLARATIYQAMVDRLAQIGLGDIPRMGPHALRATGATLAYEAGATLIECQRLLRHASIETTRQFYLKRIDEKGGDDMAKMPFRVTARPREGAV
jgi:integrase